MSLSVGRSRPVNVQVRHAGRTTDRVYRAPLGAPLKRAAQRGRMPLRSSIRARMGARVSPYTRDRWLSSM